MLFRDLLSRSLLLLLAQHISTATAGCDSYTPIFPLPKLKGNLAEFKETRDALQQKLDGLFKRYGSDVTSYSIEITSQTESLFEFHHTAVDRDDENDKSGRRGASVINGTTAYRIASNTKPFTVLALIQLQQAGKFNFDDPINHHLPELDEHQTGSLPWKDITVRTLASQLSGIPRDMGVGEIAAEDHPVKFGLPPISLEGVTTCDALTNRSKSCSSSDLIRYLRDKEPVFAPKQKSSYSNLNFDILGLLIEKLSGVSYSEYIQKNILSDLLHTKNTGFDTPPDDRGVLIKNMTYGWDTKLGVQRPTAGLYSSTNDMAKWARYVLTHYNGLTPSFNWFNPASFSTGLTSFYGTPWEIYRSDKILGPHTHRPVTFVTKGGGWPGYTSLFVLVPEYGFGYVIMTAGRPQFTMKATGIIGEYMVRKAEQIVQSQVEKSHVGHFVFDSVLTSSSPPSSSPPQQKIENTRLNSSLTISHSPDKGLYISHWISNSTDVYAAYKNLAWDLDSSSTGTYRLQLIPTLLFKDEKNQRGEIWRINTVTEESDNEIQTLFDDFCVTDVDTRSYGGVPFGEVVFWRRGVGGEEEEDEGERFDVIELSAYRVKLARDFSFPSSLKEDDNHSSTTTTMATHDQDSQPPFSWLLSFLYSAFPPSFPFALHSTSFL